MKRNNLTAIIYKALMLDSDAVLIQLKTGRKYSVNVRRIVRAAVNEIIRLEASENQRNFNEGYDKGFECARLVERTNIKCDCLGRDQ